MDTCGLHKLSDSQCLPHGARHRLSEICFKSVLFFIIVHPRTLPFRDLHSSSWHGMESPSEGRRQCKSTGFPFGAATGCVSSLIVPASRAADPVTAPTATEKEEGSRRGVPAHERAGGSGPVVERERERRGVVWRGPAGRGCVACGQQADKAGQEAGPGAQRGCR